MDVFSISSIRRGISAIISNIGNKGKVPLSGNLGMDKVLDKSDKVTGVLLMGDRDGISSGGREKGCIILKIIVEMEIIQMIHRNKKLSLLY